jgi:hypothetical protein
MSEAHARCDGILEETLLVTPGGVFIFGEDKMRQHADQRKASERIAEEKKQARRN